MKISTRLTILFNTIKVSIKKMTIRKKLTIWYSIFLFVLMLIFTAIIFFTVRFYMYSDVDNIITANTANIIEGISIGNNGYLKFDEKKIPVPSRTYFAIFDLKNEKIFDNTNWHQIETVPTLFNQNKEVHIHHEEWILRDSEIVIQNKVVGRVRMVVSTAQIESALRNIEILFLISTPIYIAIAVYGSLLIVGAALKPINEITATAQDISRLDLSRRVDDINTDDEVGRLSLTFNKMLERVELAFLREKQFSADASHELRTPLTVIQTRVDEALYGEKSKEEIIQTLNLIAAKSKKMSKIISQLLTLTKDYDNQLIVNKEPFDLADVVQDIVNEMSDFADSYGITIHYNHPGSLMMTADHMLITQMLINLITNACKYGKTNGFVSLETEIIEKKIKVSVSDNGIGISEQDLPHIFDRFFRAEKSHSGDGTGLGLSIVKWIIEAHEGTINVVSALDQGTKVEIYFPNQI